MYTVIGRGWVALYLAVLIHLLLLLVSLSMSIILFVLTDTTLLLLPSASKLPISLVCIIGCFYLLCFNTKNTSVEKFEHINIRYYVLFK